MAGANARLRARAVRWVSDKPFPGLIEVELTDGSGKLWTMVDKYPIFDRDGILTPSTNYPVNIDIACTILDRGDERVLVSTAEPWGIETVDGRHEFVMRPDQVFDDELGEDH